MSTISNPNSIHSVASAVAAPAGSPPSDPPQPGTPTVTRYQQIADDFSKALDEIMPMIPNLEASHAETAKFVRGHLNVSTDFLATAIATVEQTPKLQLLEKLDVVAARDTMQFVEAFRPVLDKVLAFADALKFTIYSRKASLAADALQIYDIAKGVARDRRGANVAAHVSNLKRDLGRRGRKSPAKQTPPASGAAA